MIIQYFADVYIYIYVCIYNIYIYRCIYIYIYIYIYIHLVLVLYHYFEYFPGNLPAFCVFLFVQLIEVMPQADLHHYFVASPVSRRPGSDNFSQTSPENVSAEHGTRPGKLSHNELENHLFSWENSLFLWQFSIAMLVYQRIKFAFGDVV